MVVKVLSQPEKTIALLTDFGLQDVYVGVMKGVIRQINPQAKVIDLTHQIPPQDLLAARFCLMNAVPYFPRDTIFVAVVDPGVGSQRRAIAIQCAQGILIAPDNGILTGVLAQFPAQQAVQLTNHQYWRVPDPSSTFHGRDIFAPVAAHLTLGVSLLELGEIIDPSGLVQLPIPELKRTDHGFQGNLQYIDYFGNLITNFPSHLVDHQPWKIIFKNQAIPGCQTYTEGTDQPIALIGSHGWIEIAVNQGNAQMVLQAKVGDLLEFRKSEDEDGTQSRNH